MKLKDSVTHPGNAMFNCPGCKEAHAVGIPPHPGAWKFNGDFEKPTLAPSILFKSKHRGIVCHSFIKEGKIQFLNDCTHDLKGKTVEIPDWD